MVHFPVYGEECYLNYDRDEFIELLDAVEDQDGVHLDDQCKARKYTWVGKKTKPAIIAGCGNETLFEIPYDGERGEESSLTVCAVDDDMGRWPRFGGDRFAS